MFVDLGVGSDDRGVDVLVLAEGWLLVAGTSAGNSALVRLTAAGALDSTFGTGGRAVFDFGGAEELRDVALAPGGRILMVGETRSPAASACRGRRPASPGHRRRPCPARRRH